MKGKPSRGRVFVGAKMSGPMVNLELRDDGGGVDLAAVARVAHERGLVSERALGNATDGEIRDLLFRAGMSTAKEVGILSGRGIGLDVARQVAEGLGGAMWIEPGPAGIGTSVRISLPTSIVSTKGLMVSAAGETLAIPIDAVERALSVDWADVKTVEGVPTLGDGVSEPLSLRWLNRFLELEEHQPPTTLQILVVSRGERRVGLVVDRVLGEQEFVAKQLPWNVPEVEGIGGAIVLPDGAVALLIDVPMLLAHGGSAGPASSGPSMRQPPVKSAGGLRILLADDALTIRELQRSSLGSAGYEVEVAVDGQDAWEKLQRGSFDLLVSDVEMPRLGGIELIRRVRADASLKRLPVVLMSSLGSEADIARGAEVGADEYVVKGRLDHTSLLETVRRLI